MKAFTHFSYISICKILNCSRFSCFVKLHKLKKFFIFLNITIQIFIKKYGGIQNYEDKRLILTFYCKLLLRNTACYSKNSDYIN